jgi:large subunit ribosomal protein L36
VKVKPSAKKITKDDYTARRKGRLYILNKRKPKHKQRQG